MALSMPIRPLKLPSGVTQAMNGQVPNSMLADPGDGKGQLLKVFALCMSVLHAKAALAGIVLTTTGRGRSLARQKAMFLERYEPVNYALYLATPSSRRKTWDNALNDAGEKYWRKIMQPDGSYPATAATPGTSNHGLNAADDLAEIVNGKVVSLRSSTLQWLYANAPELGIGWELASEPWHVHTICGDAIPAAVTAWLAPKQPDDPPPEEDDMYTDTDRSQAAEVAARVKRLEDVMLVDDAVMEGYPSIWTMVNRTHTIMTAWWDGAPSTIVDGAGALARTLKNIAAKVGAKVG